MKRFLSVLLLACPVFFSGAYIFTPIICRGSVCDGDAMLYRLFASPDLSGSAFRSAFLLFFGVCAYIAYLIVTDSDG